jgi:hypothetical protein
VVKGTPFKTTDGVTAVADKSTAGMSVFEKAMYDFGKVSSVGHGHFCGVSPSFLAVLEGGNVSGESGLCSHVCLDMYTREPFA